MRGLVRVLLPRVGSRAAPVGARGVRLASSWAAVPRGSAVATVRPRQWSAASVWGARRWASGAEEEEEAPRCFLRREDVAKHNHEDDCWIIVHGRVYDVTAWIPLHPGLDAICQNAGHDNTDLFEQIGHGHNARTIMKEYYIGDVVPEQRQQRYTAGPVGLVEGVEGQ